MAITTGKTKSANRDLVMNPQANFRELQQLKDSSIGAATSYFSSEEVCMHAVTMHIYS